MASFGLFVCVACCAMPNPSALFLVGRVVRATGKAQSGVRWMGLFPGAFSSSYRTYLILRTQCGGQP